MITEKQLQVPCPQLSDGLWGAGRSLFLPKPKPTTHVVIVALHEINDYHEHV